MALIEQKAAVSAISDLLMLQLKGERLPTWNEVYHAIYDLTPVDAVPVVHGRWIFGKDDETGERDAYAWACSECGEKYPWRPNYCPNCGARMAERREGDGDGRP